MDVVKHCMDEREQRGLQVFLKNKQYRALVSMMEDSDTKKFISQYMHDISDAHVLLMLMKLYLEIENANPHVSVFEKVLILDKLLKNRADCHNVVQLFGQWKQNALLVT